MHLEFPAQALIAAATIVGALIAGLISFVNLTLTKEQKTSEFRQAWIDGLREDLATFFSAARAFARAVEAKQALGESYKEHDFQFGTEQLGEIRLQAAQAHYKIKLRLNPNEGEHQELLRLIQCAVDAQNSVNRGQVEGTPALEALERAVEYARPVLKAEWERVKAGELPFRIVRNWVAPLVVVLCAIFLAFLFRGQFTG